MACAYCKPKPENVVYCMNYPEDSGIEIVMTNNAELRVRYYAEDEEHTAENTIAIHFCPMCGADLREGW